MALLLAGGAIRRSRAPFLASLAVAGVDGTLEHRLEPAARARPGDREDGDDDRASALSGFVRGRYAFAIVQNGAPVSSFWARQAQDRFARR